LTLAIAGSSVLAAATDRVKLRAGPAESNLLADAMHRWILVVSPARQAADLAPARDFLLAQLAEAAAGRELVPIAEIERDPALSGLADLAAYADRDGDAKLAAKEVAAWCELVRMVLAQVRLAFQARGGNLFPLLDRDGDGRLGARELAAAHSLLEGDPALTSLPPVYTLDVGGIPARHWGGLRIPAAKSAARPAAASAAPRWFAALDSNRDGVITPREFPGSPEVFRRLDKDGSGLILPDE